MKKMVMICGLVVALLGFMTFSAGATPISGAISFAGHTTFDTLFTEFMTFDNVFVTADTGDYAIVPTNNLTNPGVTFTPFVFFPPAANVIPLWSFTYAGLNYAFTATSVSLDSRNTTTGNVTVFGNGFATITGHDSTPGIWSLSGNNIGGTASFSASTAVPEPTTLLLLGFGLIGLAGFARRRFNK